MHETRKWLRGGTGSVSILMPFFLTQAIYWTGGHIWNRLKNVIAKLIRSVQKHATLYFANQFCVMILIIYCLTLSHITLFLFLCFHRFICISIFVYICVCVHKSCLMSCFECQVIMILTFFPMGIKIKDCKNYFLWKNNYQILWKYLNIL